MATKIQKEETAVSPKKVSRKKTEPKKKVVALKTKKDSVTREKVANKNKKDGDRLSAAGKTKNKVQKNKKSESGKKAVKDEKEYFLRWKGPDFIRTVGEEYLYRFSLVVSVLMSVWSFLSLNILTALTFSVLAVVLVLELRSKTKEIEYEVNLDGVLIGKNILRFSDIRSFDISSKAGFDIVRLQMKNAIFPVREVFLEENQDLVYVRSLFKYFLPEEKQEEKLFNFKDKKELTEDEALEKMVDDYMKDKS